MTAGSQLATDGSSSLIMSTLFEPSHRQQQMGRRNSGPEVTIAPSTSELILGYRSQDARGLFLHQRPDVNNPLHPILLFSYVELGLNMVPLGTLTSGHPTLVTSHGPGATFLGKQRTSSSLLKQLICHRYFTKFEKFNPHPDYPLVDAAARGNSGPVNVGYFNTVTNASKAFVRACVEVNIPFTHDFNGPNGTLGVSRVRYSSSNFGLLFRTFLDH